MFFEKYRHWIVKLPTLAWKGVTAVAAALLSLALVHCLKKKFLVELEPQIEKPLRHTLETLFIHAFGLIAAYWMTITCRDVTIGLRNNNRQTAALKRQGDDPNNSPAIGEPSIEALNRPWVVERKNKLPSDVDTFTKVWVMGRYKVGKTTLLNWLGVDTARPSNLVNTRGEIFYTARSWLNTLFVDTEGFDQPINVTEPEFRKRLVIAHAHRAADAIILVVPMLSVGDMTLFQRNIKAMRSRKTSLFVVHNISSITNLSELMHYSRMFGSIYNRPDTRDLPEAFHLSARVEEDALITQHGAGISGVSVTHFFLGGNDHLREWNMSQIRNLSSRLKHIQSQSFPLIASLKESLRLVGSSTYAFGNSPNVDVNCEVEEKVDDRGDEHYELHFTENITESMARVIGGNTILGYTLDYKWLPARETRVGKRKVYRQRLLIGTSRVKIMDMEIPDETTIKIRFQYWNAFNDVNEESVRYSISGGSESIAVEYPLVTNQELIIDDKACEDSAELCIDAVLNITHIDAI